MGALVNASNYMKIINNVKILIIPIEESVEAKCFHFFLIAVLVISGSTKKKQLQHVTTCCHRMDKSGGWVGGWVATHVSG